MLATKILILIIFIISYISIGFLCGIVDMYIGQKYIEEDYYHPKWFLLMIFFWIIIVPLFFLFKLIELLYLGIDKIIIFVKNSFLLFKKIYNKIWRKINGKTKRK